MTRTLRVCASLAGVTFLILVVFGCAKGADPNPTPKPTPTPTPTVMAKPTATPTSTPAPAPTPTSTPNPTPTTEATDLFLMVLSPADNSVVDVPEVPVSGMTVPNSYLSVNGVSVLVGSDGSFSTTVVLEEGPNLIEVIVSDGNGDEQSAVLAIIYIAA